MNEPRDTTGLPAAGATINEELAELLRRVAETRDREALSTLFAHFAPRVKSMMLKRGANDALAEDLAQETLLTVWRKAHMFSDQRGAASTWIFTIARNLRIDQARRQTNKPYEDLEALDLASDAATGLHNVERIQIIERVGKALTALPPEQSEVVRLSFVGEIPHSEIAVRLGIPLGTVKSRLRLAYDRLRPLLEDLQ